MMGLGLSVGVLASPRLNEVMTSNGSSWEDEEGGYPDWIELHHPGEGVWDLTGYGLSDRPGQPFKWRFTGGAIEPGGYLVVFASGKDRQPLPSIPRSPLEVSGLKVWWSGSEWATNDTRQVRRVGNRLWARRWMDASGQGADGVEAEAGRQPELLWDEGVGRWGLRFDGVDDRLQLGRVVATNAFTWMAVFRTDVAHEVDGESTSGVGGVSGQRWLLGAGHGGDADAGMGVSVGTNGVSVYEHGSGYMPAVAVHAAAVGTGWTLVTVTYRDRRPEVARQGVRVRTGEASPRREVWASTELGSGAYGAFSGVVGEVLWFDRALTEEERQGVEAWVGSNYGVRGEAPRHTNFSLSAEGESLVLTAPDGRRVDRVDLGRVPRDVSVGRVPDGDGVWRWFEEPTPGGPNVTPWAERALGPVTFSVAPGFHRGTVTLGVAGTDPDMWVAYTVDGSEPGWESPRYMGPLVLADRSGSADVLAIIPTAPGWRAPSGRGYKGWVVRARAMADRALPGPVATGSYFITPKGRDRYTVPVVSLSGDRRHFFDSATGIYVPGTAPGGNYFQRGPDWEKPGFLELFEGDGSRPVARDVLVSIHGNTSQGFPIKGLDVDAENGRGGEPIRHRLFPDRDREEFDHVLLRPSGHDHDRAFMRDELMQSLMGDTGALGQAARLCVVFLNGEYWGLHYLKEKQDRQFVEHYAGSPSEGVDYLEGYATPRAGDARGWEALTGLLASEPVVDDRVLEGMARWMELESYTDYKAAEVFTYRWDIGNHRFWRPRTEGGRFRWLQFDNDVGWGGFWAASPAWDYDMLGAVLSTDGRLNGHNNETTTLLFRRLMEHRVYRMAWVNRMCDLLNTLYRTEHTVARIDAMASVIEPEMAEHSRRWRAPSSLEAWRGEVAYLRTYAERRPAAVRGHLRQRYGLGADVRVRAWVTGGGMGTLWVNTVPVTALAGLPWEGRYFQQHPVEVRAEPAAGSRWVGWEGLAGVTTNRVILRFPADAMVGARFEKDEVTLGWRREGLGWRLIWQGAPGGAVTLEVSEDLHAWRSLAQGVADGMGRWEWDWVVEAGSGQRYVRGRVGE